MTIIAIKKRNRTFIRINSEQIIQIQQVITISSRYFQFSGFSIAYEYGKIIYLQTYVRMLR